MNARKEEKIIINVFIELETNLNRGNLKSSKFRDLLP